MAKKGAKKGKCYVGGGAVTVTNEDRGAHASNIVTHKGDEGSRARREMALIA